jgi:hypothetical protein
MYNRLISFVAKSNILKEAKNGLGNQTLIGTIQEAMDRVLHAIGLFFDLTEAYDVINHDTLLDKLNSYHIRSKTNLSIK